MADLAAIPGPALAMLDVGDVPRGLWALDVLVKEAEVHVLRAGTVSDGRYLILVGGEVEAVSRGHARSRIAAGPALRDDVLLPYAEEHLAPAVLYAVIGKPARGDTLGVVQLDSSPSILRAVDAALKGANVDLIQLRLGDGLGGKAIATLWGETHDVEAALELAEAAARRGRAAGWSAVRIRNADDAVTAAVRDGTRFHREWHG